MQMETAINNLWGAREKGKVISNTNFTFIMKRLSAPIVQLIIHFSVYKQSNKWHMNGYLIPKEKAKYKVAWHRSRLTIGD